MGAIGVVRVSEGKRVCHTPERLSRIQRSRGRYSHTTKAENVLKEACE